MHRDAKIREYNPFYDEYLSEKESLLIQLCEHIYSSGFVFYDSTTSEIEAGEWVIWDFFDQQSEVFVDLVSRNRLNNFTDYLNNFDWPKKQLKAKLCQRILKSFDRLAAGKHHHFNVRQNIAQGLEVKENHPLYDLLLYIETYYNLILVGKFVQKKSSESSTNFTKKNFKLGDLQKLRNQIQDHLLGKEIVKRSLQNIAKIRGVSLESLIPSDEKIERKYPRIIFIKPPLKTYKTEKKIKSNLNSETKNINSLSDIVDLRFRPIHSSNQNNHIEPISETNIDNSKLETDVQIEDTMSKSYKDSKSLDDKNHNLEDKDKFDATLSDSYDADVVFGNKKINQLAMEAFVREYPDSALKFIFRKNLDGRPLLKEIDNIYFHWEKRGLVKDNLKEYVLKLMKWSEIPDMPMHNLLKILRERIYEVSKENKS